MAGKKAYEYVFIKGHPIILSNLKIISGNLQANVNAAYETSQLYTQKHEVVQRALASANELMGEMYRLKKLMPVKEVRRRPAIFRQAASSAPTIVDEDFLERSQKALQHLDKNIAELRSELGKIR